MAEDTQDLDYWLTKLRERKWYLHFLGERGDTREVGAVLTWPDVWDVVVLLGEPHALAYRTPRAEGLDPFAPEYIVDSYAGPATWTLRWILTLAPPGTGLPPLRPVPADFSIPKVRRRPVTIRPVKPVH